MWMNEVQQQKEDEHTCFGVGWILSIHSWPWPPLVVIASRSRFFLLFLHSIRTWDAVVATKQNVDEVWVLVVVDVDTKNNFGLRAIYLKFGEIRNLWVDGWWWWWWWWWWWGTVILFWDANDTHWRKPAWVLTSSSALISATPRRRQMARTPLGDVPNMMIPDNWDVSRHLTAPAVVGEWYQGTEQESFKGSSKISPWKVLAIWRTQVIILVLFIASWAMSWAHNATKCPICSMVCNSEEEKKTQILETMWVGIVYAHRHMTTINFPLTWINNRDYLQNHSWEMVTSLQANSQMMGSWKLGNPPPLAACSLVHMVPKQGCLSLFPYTTDSKVWHTDVRSTDIFQAWEGTPPCKKTFILQILISAFLKKKIYLVSQTHKLKCNVDSTLWRVIFEVWD